MSPLILSLEALLRTFPAALLFLFIFQHHLRIKQSLVVPMLGLYAIINSLIPTLLYIFLPESIWIIAYTFVYLILVFFCCLYVVDFSPYRILLVYFIIANYTDAIGLMKDYMGGFCTSLIADWGYFPTSMMLRCIVLVITMPCMLYFCKRFLRPIIDQPNDAIFYKYLWLIPASFFIMYRTSINPQKDTEIIHVFNEVSCSEMSVWVIGTYLVYIMVLKMLQEMIKKADLEQQLERTALLQSMQEKQYENLLSQIKENRRNRHDFHHNILAIKKYCDEGEYERLSAYVNQYIGSLSLDKQLLFCEDPLIDSILQYYAGMAKQYGIACTMEVQLPKLHFNDIDICTLLGNGLENAIEACNRQTRGRRFVHFKAETHNAHIVVITIKNSYEGEIRKTGTAFLSSKRKEEGIGITSMQQIVEKYNGVCKYTYDGNIFTLSIMMNLPQG